VSGRSSSGRKRTVTGEQSGSRWSGGAPRVPPLSRSTRCMHARARFTAARITPIALRSRIYLYAVQRWFARALIISAVKKINRRQENTRAASGGNYRRPRPNGLKNARPQIKVPASRFGVGAICPYVALPRTLNTHALGAYFFLIFQSRNSRDVLLLPRLSTGIPMIIHCRRAIGIFTLV
jgi:hypothetical protein